MKLAMALLTAGITAGALLVLSPAAHTASTEGSNTASEAKSTNYSVGEKAIKAKDWVRAIDLLQKAVETDPTNANAYNYLGYAYRNLKQYDKALSHYKEALRLDPGHRGAHEYVGETYLALGDLKSAKKHLARLDDLCTFGCEEYDELKEEVEKYENAQK